MAGSTTKRAPPRIQAKPGLAPSPGGASTHGQGSLFEHFGVASDGSRAGMPKAIVAGLRCSSCAWLVRADDHGVCPLCGGVQADPLEL